MLKQGYFYPKTDAECAAVRTRFPGTRVGAMEPQDIVHNGGWYNQLGEEIGWGDFSIKSMQRLALCLNGDDIIVIVGESARCGYDHPDRASWNGEYQMKYDWSYLLKRVRWVLKDGTIYRVCAAFTMLAAGNFDGCPVVEVPVEIVPTLIQ